MRASCGPPPRRDSDDDLVILARTDARGVESFDDAIERAKRYLDAGADWIFPEALADAGEFDTFAEAVDAPLVANMTEFGKSPLLTLDELAEMGYAAVLYPVTLLRMAMKAVEAALAVIAADGTQAELLDLMQTRQELYDLIEYSDYEARDRAYFSRQNSRRNRPHRQSLARVALAACGHPNASIAERHPWRNPSTARVSKAYRRRNGHQHDRRRLAVSRLFDRGTGRARHVRGSGLSALHGELPNRRQLAAFRKRLADSAAIPPAARSSCWPRFRTAWP